MGVSCAHRRETHTCPHFLSGRATKSSHTTEMSTLLPRLLLRCVPRFLCREKGSAVPSLPSSTLNKVDLFRPVNYSVAKKKKKKSNLGLGLLNSNMWSFRRVGHNPVVQDVTLGGVAGWDVKADQGRLGLAAFHRRAESLSGLLSKH